MIWTGEVVQALHEADPGSIPSTIHGATSSAWNKT